MSEGGGGRWRGNRGSRCRDGTLANRLLHDTPPLHIIHHVFYIETTGEMEERDERPGKSVDVKRRKTHRPEEEFGGGCAGGGEGGWEEKHFGGILLDQYKSAAISMVNNLCCIQFALFPEPQNHFTASTNRALCFSLKQKRAIM